MNIIITTNTLNYGGAERQRVTLANGLAAKGNSVQIRVIQQTGPLEDELSPDVAVCKVNSILDTRDLPTGVIHIISGTTKTEVAHAYLLRCRRIMTARWFVASHNPVVDGLRTYPRFVRSLVPVANGHICLSYSQASSLVQTDNFNWNKISIIENGIETRALDSVRRDRGHASVNATARILFVGRLVDQKGLDVLLLSLAKMTHLDWKLDIVGAGPMIALRDSSELSAIQDRITWWGARDPADLYRVCDLLVVPSRNEAYPLVLIEALVSGIPVVTTNVGSIPEILQGGSAILVDPGEATQLCGAISRAIKELPEMRDRAMEQGSAYATRFSAAAMVDRYQYTLGRGRQSEVVLQVGPSIRMAGGISSVISDYQKISTDGPRKMLPIASYGGAGVVKGVRSLLSATCQLISSRLAHGRVIAHVHLSQGGSFTREGFLLRFAHLIGLYTVATVHGSRFDEFYKQKPHAVFRALRNTGQIVVLTDSAKAAMGELGLGARTNEIFNAVHVPRAPYPRDWASPVVLFAGEVGTRKGIDVLLAAWGVVMEKCPDARLKVAGPLTKGWTEHILNGQDGVMYVGELRHSELLALLRSVTISVLPSRAEAMPKFVLESLAAGVPVVATTVGALDRVVTPEVGILVGAADVVKLADSLHSLVVNPKLCSVMGGAAHQRALGLFSNDAHLERLEAVYSAARHADRRPAARVDKTTSESEKPEH